MKAFHGSLEIKNKYLSRVMAHQAADELIQGTGWERGKGCAVGCTLNAYDHSRYETELGLPNWLARLEDRIFEGLTPDKAQEWPIKFLAAIHPGADVESVKRPFLVFILEGALTQFDHVKNPAVAESIRNVIKLLLDPNATPEQFLSARSAAADAAADANAADAAAAAAADAADAAADANAADAAAAAAADAAYAAAAAAAYAAYAYAYAARSDAYEQMADKLLELLGNCKSIERLGEGGDGK